MVEIIANFIIEHIGYIDKETIKEYIIKHAAYGTIDYEIDEDNNVIAVCRWNVFNNGTTAEVLDFVIKEEYRNKRFGNNFIRRALERFPDMQWLEFRRGNRNKNIRKLEIKKVLKRRF